MAKGFQNSTIIGNLGAEPSERLRVVKTANGDQSVLTVGVAVTERQGQDPEWFNCTFWGGMAEALAQYAGKGSTIHVEARRRTTTKETDEGVKKFEEYVVSTMNILTFKGGSTGSQSEDEEYASPPSAAPRPGGKGRQTYQAPQPRQGFQRGKPQAQAPQSYRKAQAAPGYDADEALGFGPEEDFQ